MLDEHRNKITLKEYRRRSRVMVGGRLVSFLEDCEHGTLRGYQSFICRCLSCTDVNRIASSEYLSRRRKEAFGSSQPPARESTGPARKRRDR